jgi:glycosyltransferase involved in cell wall biosynthesis
MPTRPLRIAWLGPGPGDDGGVSGVAADLLAGLSAEGHRIDCFLPGKQRPLSPRLTAHENLSFIWGTSAWKWDRWYSRAKVAAFVSGLVARALAALRLRQEIARRHSREPYDLIYQFSTIENLAVPSGVAREVPLVIHPETHIAGELRFLIAERRLSWRCQPRYMFAVVAGVMFIRMLVQRVRIRRASLLVCISSVFRDHLVHDYRVAAERTVVIPNPVRVERFVASESPPGAPAKVLVLGRIAARKGIDDVVALARLLDERRADVHIRIVGGPSLWSDYTPLLEDLPPRISEYAGSRPAAEVPAELAASDLLLQASRYEPFALTVGEALAAGVPVVGTSEVGAIESVERSVAAEVRPGDVEGMADAVIDTLNRLRSDPQVLRSRARGEAERLFAPAVVCRQISEALERLIGPGAGGDAAAAAVTLASSS